MPRKQRFKPSRKPQNTQAAVSNQPAEQGKEISSNQNVSEPSSINEEQAPREIERE
jgi:hypothetical protein